MSVEASKWAWEQLGLSPAEKLVLLCLADHADENGENCFPSQRRIAQKTDLRKETVTRAVRALRERGLIRTQPNQRPGTVSKRPALPPGPGDK